MFLAQRFTAQQLFAQIQQNQPLTSRFFSNALKRSGAFNHEEAADKDEFESAMETYSLTSEISLNRIQRPVRSVNCTHFNKCMDLEEYVQHVSLTLQQTCYVCKSTAPFSSLRVDAFAQFLL